MTTLLNDTYSECGSNVIASAAMFGAFLPSGSHTASFSLTTYPTNAGTSVGAVAYVLSPAAKVPTFTMSASPTTLPFLASADATTNISYTPANGFSGAVTLGLSCESGCSNEDIADYRCPGSTTYSLGCFGTPTVYWWTSSMLTVRAWSVFNSTAPITLRVTGTSGSQSSYVDITLNPDTVSGVTNQIQLSDASATFDKTCLPLTTSDCFSVQQNFWVGDGQPLSYGADDYRWVQNLLVFAHSADHGWEYYWCYNIFSGSNLATPIAGQSCFLQSPTGFSGLPATFSLSSNISGDSVSFSGVFGSTSLGPTSVSLGFASPVTPYIALSAPPFITDSQQIQDNSLPQLVIVGADSSGESIFTSGGGTVSAGFSYAAGTSTSAVNYNVLTSGQTSTAEQSAGLFWSQPASPDWFHATFKYVNTPVQYTGDSGVAFEPAGYSAAQASATLTARGKGPSSVTAGAVTVQAIGHGKVLAADYGSQCGVGIVVCYSKAGGPNLLIKGPAPSRSTRALSGTRKAGATYHLSYFSVSVPKPKFIDKLALTNCAGRGKDRMLWWNPQANYKIGAWVRVSANLLSHSKKGCLLARLTKSTTPSIANLK